MKRSSEPQTGFVRDKLIGLGETSMRKNYYPELQRRLEELETFRSLLDKVNDHLYLMNQELFGFLPHLVTAEEVVYVVGDHIPTAFPEPRPSRLIVDLTGGRETELLAFSEKLSELDTDVLFLVQSELRKGVILPRNQSVLTFTTDAGASDIIAWLKE